MNHRLIAHPQDPLRDGPPDVAFRRFLQNDQPHQFEPTLDRIQGDTPWPEWFTYLTQSSRVGDGSIPPVSVRLASSNQEAWNHLQVTGLQRYPVTPGLPPLERYCRTDDRHWKYPDHKSSWDPELSGPATAFSPSDSGYGSKCSATRSVTSTSYNTETISSPCPLTTTDCNTLGVASIGDNNGVQSGDVSFGIVGPIPAYSPYQNERKCDYPGCKWTGKCPSDKRSVFFPAVPPRCTNMAKKA
jgi:hypothetical protein